MGCRREVSSPEILEVEIDLAMRDWAEIPTVDLDAACTKAARDSEGFMPTNGAVVKAHRDTIGERHDAAQRAIREANSRKYLNIPPVERTPEEKKQLEEFFRNIRDSLK